MSNNIYKFNEYVTEDMYSISDNGIQKIDMQIYKDFYPEKWLYINISEQNEKQIFDSKFVWVLKYKNEYVSILSDKIPESVIRQIGTIIDDNI